MPLALLFDECVDARIARGVRSAGVDVLTTVDAKLCGATDPVQLQAARRLGRVLVSADADFLRIVKSELEVGRDFPGVIFVKPGAQVGNVIRAIVRHVAMPPEQFVNRVYWAP